MLTVSPITSINIFDLFRNRSTTLAPMALNSRKAIIVLVLATVFTGCSKKSARPNPGILQWKSTDAHLVAKPGELELFADFPFVNQTGNTITITSVESDCECTLPQLDEKTYAPKASGIVKVKIRVGMNQGKEEKHIKVAITGASKPDILTLRFEIPEVLRIEPRALSWDLGKEAEAKSIEIQVV